MPIINGQKMACEPCIRGHRSTKCNHAKERLMVPVRKPGRPLSTCPHPPNRMCGCSGITAAIPKSQKCGCGSETEPVTTPTIKMEADSPKTVTSPTRRSFSIHKSAPKPGPRIDPTTLDRVDISQMNIHPSPSWNGPVVPLGPSGYAVPLHTPPLPMHYQPPIQNGLSNGYDHSGSIDYINHYALGTPQPVHSPFPQSTSSEAPKSSCCAPPASARHTPASSTASLASSVPSTTRSCCSSKTDDTSLSQTDSAQQKPTVNGSAGHHRTNSTLRSPIDAESNGDVSSSMAPPGTPLMTPTVNPVSMDLHPHHHQIMASYFQPPGPMLYTYSAPYGTVQAPLQPAHWRQNMSTMPYVAPLLSDALAHLPGRKMSVASDGHAGAQSHMCSCGDGCNCIGCAAHPYNEATQDYVRSALNSMMEQPHRNGNGNSVRDDATGKLGAPEQAAPVAAGAASDPSSPPQAHTPSDASGISEDQAQLSANDFLFVTYPFGLCGGETMSCPCGDDCNCVGCLIHGTPGEEVPWQA